MGSPPGVLCASRAMPLDAGTLRVQSSAAPGLVGTAPSASEPPTATPKQQIRLIENRAALQQVNVKAFLAAIAKAEGGDYNLMYGGVKGRRNDKWRFSDVSTHPGAGSDGKTTAAGMYQINKATWKEMGGKMGLVDFSAETQDLLAVELLRTIHVLDDVQAGRIDAALSAASRRWAALPQGKDLPGRHNDQPYLPYAEFIATYRSAGGSTVP